MKVFTQNRSKSIIPRSDIYELQVYLEKEGYGDFVPSGVYGNLTQSAIAKFQKEHLITPSIGNFGEKTRLKLNMLLFPKQQILHEIAMSVIGVDISPLDRAPDALACVESFLCVYEAALGSKLSNTLSTIELINIFRNNPKKFRLTNTPKAGTIRISETDGNRHGHVGIHYSAEWIMSNSSSNGKWEKNYTINGWEARYGNKLGLVTEMYDLI